MRSILILLVILTGGISKGVCQTINWDSVVQQSPILYEVHVVAATERGYAVLLVRHHKGQAMLGNFIEASKTSIQLKEGEDYLFFAKNDKAGWAMTHDPIAKGSFTAELNAVIDKLPCFDEKESAEYRKKREPGFTGACLRTYEPVCGCDGVNYGSPCEAHMRGIVKYKSGRCKVSN